MPNEPLKPAVLHILLAIADGEMHGLGIADWVEQATAGAMELGPGTLYRSLKEMAAAGLIRDAAAPHPDADPRRRYYAIMPQGRAQMRAEAEWLERLVELAIERNLLPGRS
jgi:DNA-binding PadR family transcriptional regulator